MSLQALYEFNISSAPSWASLAGLPQLYVEEFDTEQIWGQLDAASGPVLKQLRRRIKRLGPDVQLLDETTEEALDGEGSCWQALCKLQI